MLYRPVGGSMFSAVANGEALNNGNVTFNNVVFQSGDYAIGVANSPFPVSVIEYDLAEAIVLSPNPSEGVFSISLRSGLTLDAQVDILDITGKVVLSRELILSGATRSAQFDIANHGRGIYLVRVQTTAGTHTQRFTVR